MRVPKNQLQFLKTKTIDILPSTKVYLLGSRTNDSFTELILLEAILI